MFGQRRRRWPNIETTLDECLLFAGRASRPHTFLLLSGYAFLEIDIFVLQFSKHNWLAQC